MKHLRLMQQRYRVLLVGPPGIGKTAIVLEAAKNLGYKVVVRRASVADRVDFSGAMFPDPKNGITRELPLELLKELKVTTTPTLLFLDDLGQAPTEVQAALMRLFDDDALSPNVLIWAATNRPGDKAGVTAICEPLRSRFHLAFALPTPGAEDKPDGGQHLYTWTEQLDAWVQWAMDNDAAPEIIAWHRSTSGRTLYQWKPHSDPAVRMADFRSWETVLRLRKDGIRDLQTTAAAIGKPTAAEYCAFEQLADKVPTPDQIRMDPTGAPTPSDPAQLYLTVSMLASACQPSDAAPFCKYLQRLPRVFGALLGRDMYRKLGAKLSGVNAWIEWFTANQKLFV